VPAATPVARAEVARLRAQADDVSDIPVFEGATTLGRRSGNDWVIAGDPFVSGRHARLDAAGLSVTITDLGSTNGTTVNGERLPPDVPLPLESGDEVALGKGRYVLEHAAPADEEPAGYDDTPVDDDLDGDAVLSETDGEAA
jgi:pSer/pThr/pTyr-binding forkhead associated (FHA) protein